MKQFSVLAVVFLLLASVASAATFVTAPLEGRQNCITACGAEPSAIPAWANWQTCIANCNPPLIGLQGNLTAAKNSVTAETAARQAADATLQTNVNNEASARVAGDTSGLSSAKSYTDSSVASESAARQSADATLQNNLNAETAARAAGDSSTLTAARQYSDAGDAATLTTANAYTDLKAAAEAALRAGSIDAAKQALTDMINLVRSDLTGMLNNEAAARLSGDATLQTQIDGYISAHQIDHARLGDLDQYIQSGLANASAAQSSHAQSDHDEYAKVQGYVVDISGQANASDAKLNAFQLVIDGFQTILTDHGSRLDALETLTVALQHQFDQLTDTFVSLADYRAGQSDQDARIASLEARVAALESHFPAAPAEGSACNDGSACTQTDTIQNGVCVGSNQVNCDDGDVSTSDLCDQQSGLCHHSANADADGDGIVDNQDNCPTVANSDQRDADGNGVGDACEIIPQDGTPCNDGNACTQSDVMMNGVCTGRTPVVCQSTDACHAAGACDPQTGQCSNPAASDGTACDDGSPCTAFDRCQSGVCASTTAASCDDGNACTSDGCDAAYGCFNTAVSCNDNDPNTADSCDRQTGCQHTPIACPYGSATCGQSQPCKINLFTDLNNCGGCNNACPPVFNGVSTCSNGACTVGVCNPGFSDCDHQLGDGCETQLNTNFNCGQCNLVCPNGFSCTNGACVSPCPPGVPANCPGGTCSVVHSNGVGQNYFDCAPKGTPGQSATYTLTMAQEARAAWGQPSIADNLVGCIGGNDGVLRQTATSCSVWIYNGPLSGRVRQTLTSNDCFCPFDTNNPSWT
jgi:hypothetical protein